MISFKSEDTKLLLWVGGLLVFFWFLWYYSGGKEQALRELTNPEVVYTTSKPAASTQTPPSTPAWNTGSGGNAASSGDPQQTSSGSSWYDQTRGAGITNKSPHFGKVRVQLGAIGSTRSEDEYLLLRAESTNKGPLDVSDWTLVSIEGALSVPLGKGATLPYGPAYNASETIFFYPGDSAYVITGRSPIQTSFRVNKCLGYFEQYQRFSPSIGGHCPALRDEPLPSRPNRLSENCVDYILGLSGCTVPQYYPDYVDYSCRAYIAQHVGYERCVSLYKNDADFYQKDWRIYLNRDSSLWKRRNDTIELRDGQGKVVDRVAY